MRRDVIEPATEAVPSSLLGARPQDVDRDPLDEHTQMGPLISARRRERVSSYVDGASVAMQGSSPDGRGFWFPPTVLFPAAVRGRPGR